MAGGGAFQHRRNITDARLTRWPGDIPRLTVVCRCMKAVAAPATVAPYCGAVGDR